MSIIPDPIWKPVDIVYGVYQFEGETTGDDRWWIQRLVESETGWMIHNDIYLDRPEKRYITVDVELDDDWSWRYLNLRDNQGRILSAEVEAGRVVVERRGVELESFPFDCESELDFMSPFMNSLTLRRLRLVPGQSVTRSVVWFQEDFTPHLVSQSYTRGDDTAIEMDNITLAAQQVHFVNHDSGFEATLLVREDGLVLAYPGYAALAFDERASAGRGIRPPI